MLEVGSSALQDWQALLISFWILFCACVSTYVYSPEESVQDWLWIHCNVIIQRIQAEFSSRRSMLSVLVYLNPDSKDGRTDWINPILASIADRKDWETVLLTYIGTGEPPVIFYIGSSWISYSSVSPMSS